MNNIKIFIENVTMHKINFFLFVRFHPFSDNISVIVTFQKYTKTTHCQLFYFYLKNALSINNISTPKCINKSPKKYNNQQIIHIRRRALKNNHLNLLLCLGELESHCAYNMCNYRSWFFFLIEHRMKCARKKMRNWEKSVKIHSI